jgi:dihydroorotate dehydrogenase electron transfer subunit
MYTATVAPVDVHARVAANARLSYAYNVVTLEAPAIAARARPGQFVMVKPARGTDPLLRRPFSIFETLSDAQGSPAAITLLNKRVGVGTSLLFELEAGATLACLGPLGLPFEPVDPPGEAWMVAGGVGLAPFATLATALVQRGTKTRLFYGGRSAADLFYVDWFERRGVDVVLATEDGSRGEPGRVTAPLARALERAGATATIYACGPTPMMRAVAALAARHRRPAFVSLEQVMGCGLGGCYSCVVQVRRNSDAHYVRSCIEGPVFDAAGIVWDALA